MTLDPHNKQTEEEKEREKITKDEREHTTMRLGIMAVFILICFFIYRATGCAEVTQLPTPK